MFNIVCWILIGICCFYLLRNLWAGMLYKVTDMKFQASVKINNQKKIYKFKDLMPRRNYYLFVLNPLWWGPADVFKDKSIRIQIRERMKNLRKI